LHTRGVTLYTCNASSVLWGKRPHVEPRHGFTWTWIQMDMHTMVNSSLTSLPDKCAQRGNLRTNPKKVNGLQKGNKCSRGPSKKDRHRYHARARERLCIHRSHACTSLALIVVHHLSHSQAPCVHRRSCFCSSPAQPALIVLHRRSRSQAPCASTMRSSTLSC
jgi:hypothetical protein